MGPKRRSTKPPVSSTPSKSSSQKSSSSSTQSRAPEKLTPLQFHLLALFPHAFPNTLSAGPDALKQRIQRVKQALYFRDFATAFAEAEAQELEAYAFRWSPTRALGYCDLFCLGETGALIRRIFDEEEGVRWGRNSSQRQRDPSHGAAAELTQEIERISLNKDGGNTGDALGKTGLGPPKVVALGGGAGAEVVAFAGMLAQLHPFRQSGFKESPTTEDVSAEEANSMVPHYRVHMHVLDIAPWHSVLSALQSAIASLPTSSTSSLNSDRPLLPPDAITLTFTQADVLAMDTVALAGEIVGSRVVTILFTLNELYGASKGGTTALLLNLTDLLEKGAMLLVVDSAGSYAAVDVGGARKGEDRGEAHEKGEGKRYPMHFLFDHTLLEVASMAAEAGADDRLTRSGDGRATKKRRRWRKVHEEKARWFRLPEEVDYPLDLEDMRMQVHCYERI